MCTAEGRGEGIPFLARDFALADSLCLARIGGYKVKVLRDVEVGTDRVCVNVCVMVFIVFSDNKSG